MKDRKEVEHEKPEKQKETEPENEDKKEKEEEKSAEKTRQEVRTPVRERVKRLNKKATASPGKFPLVKQQMLDLYFKKKSPKAIKARDKAEPDSNNKYKYQGLDIVPLRESLVKLGP